ncbi:MULTISPECIES: type I DNA topoisomerase [unclassified Arthrobacter]|uniref:type I DNA topoisomerase n=1 Tax=unclassified Arthrobacter TaxID=235627 RepID=UPI0024DFAA43|nr:MULTISPECIES: type I DNA topoisomerase [unclassified Arthrobacter]MCC9144725.1 type I DNA topoisomerase [Arthrobacter sp. zg-Y919]MDK1275951.1 type I DNA topoisomerase [Arthrobacter sp. zg.Y919]WIB02697.1 type I DNA topoisomerase [Arthrobacter sp. zg-Y919]
MPVKATDKKTGKKLVIVESPAKGKTIAGYLGEGFEVTASMGHIRDLPQPSDLPAELKKTGVGKFAVDLDNDFEPYYVVSADKRKKVAELKAALKDADELYLATDGDREGEAIAWHLLQVLKPKVPVHRLTFPEITREAIQRALLEMRDVDVAMVDAQETRRILDRLYGYEISPVLWRKVARGLSAGRVQSVATRLVVERERERMAFRAASYWDLVGTFATEAAEKFKARLVAVDGARVATGKDFTDRGELKSKTAVHLDEAAAVSLAAGLESAAFSVRSVDTKPYTRRPAAPFTTSTLQQEAGRKLRFSSRVTMQVAQRLYENGYITYMRTDSPALSDQAINAARRQASELYGPEYVPEARRVYKGKSKNAQEAHEAIRPAGDSFRTPAQVASSLRGDEFRLYELIWKRTVASQMADAKGSTASVRIGGVSTDGRDAEFSASGTVITFRGFMAAYEEGRDAVREDDEAEGTEGARLPVLKAQDALTAADIAAGGHETSPPPRFTEASLVKMLEELGIGRPSTYAATISTIMDRGYVTSRGQALVPSWIAFSVVRLLEEHFTDYVDYDFTAELEEDLDRISRGEAGRVEWLNQFYYGDRVETGLHTIVNDLGEIDAKAINSIEIADGIVLRVGKFGPYLERPLPADAPEGTEPERANVPEDLAPDELTAAKALELMETAAPEERVLGTDPETGRTIVARNGRYGPYVIELIPEITEEELANQPVEYYKNGKPKPPKKPVKAKPRTGSLFKSMSVETVTLDEALKLMKLPRVLGTDAEGNEITVQNGRFGPYLKKGTDSRSIGSEEEIFTITLEQALEIYSQPKQRGGRQAAAPLAEFGADPVSEKPIVVKDGRFGPYITDGITNITVPRSTAIEELTREQAIELLAEKREKGPAKKPVKKRAAPRKAAAKK